VTSLTPGKVTSVEVSFVGINNFGCVVWKMALKGSEETRALSFASKKEKEKNNNNKKAKTAMNQQVAQESIHKRAWRKVQTAGRPLNRCRGQSAAPL